MAIAYEYPMALLEWFLSAPERDNPDTVLDDPHPGADAWSRGNAVRPLIHGATYYQELKASVERAAAGDQLFFVDWRGDPDQRLTDDPADEIGTLLCRAAERGVAVRGLVWRSHLDRLQFSATENRHLGDEIEAAGGQCLRDMRVRMGGSHHQKFVVLRHHDRPELDVAYLGGIDLCHSRRDDSSHAGDPQKQPMAAVYGSRPPWHDVQLAIRGPAVADIETVFRERWNDPRMLTRNPVHVVADKLRRDDPARRQLPERRPDPAPAGMHAVQLLRTYPRRIGGYACARRGERSVALGYIKAIRQARKLIYLEDQYLWSTDVAAFFADALRRNPELRFVAVLPLHPDQDGRMSMPPNLIGRSNALSLIRSAAPDRVAIYGLESPAGVPVYVHAKVCVIDDTWACVGSDNLNRRSWTHDSEIGAAVLDESPDPHAYARNLRLELAREHLDRAAADDADLHEGQAFFDAYAASADALRGWHTSGGQGPRPPGRLLSLNDPPLSAATRLWAAPLYRLIYDPDGRTRRDRRQHRF